MIRWPTHRRRGTSHDQFGDRAADRLPAPPGPHPGLQLGHVLRSPRSAGSAQRAPAHRTLGLGEVLAAGRPVRRPRAGQEPALQRGGPRIILHGRPLPLRAELCARRLPAQRGRDHRRGRHRLPPSARHPQRHRPDLHAPAPRGDDHPRHALSRQAGLDIRRLHHPDPAPRGGGYRPDRAHGVSGQRHRQARPQPRSEGARHPLRALRGLRGPLPTAPRPVR